MSAWVSKMMMMDVSVMKDWEGDKVGDRKRLRLIHTCRREDDSHRSSLVVV